MSNRISHKTSTRLDLNVAFLQCIIISSFRVKCIMSVVSKIITLRAIRFINCPISTVLLFFSLYMKFPRDFCRKKTCFFSLSKVIFFVLVKHATVREVWLCMKNRKVNMLGQNRYRPEKAGQTAVYRSAARFYSDVFFYRQTEHVWSRASVTACERRSTVARVFFLNSKIVFPVRFSLRFWGVLRISLASYSPSSTFKRYG